MLEVNVRQQFVTAIMALYAARQYVGPASRGGDLEHMLRFSFGGLSDFLVITPSLSLFLILFFAACSIQLNE